MSLILYENKVCIAQIAQYRRLQALGRAEYDKLRSLVNQIDKVLRHYSDQHEDLCKRRHELKLDIRLATRGTPVTEPMSVVTEQSVADFETLSEAQKTAFDELLKRSYRATAMLAHPDRGGTQEDFATLEAAYRHKNLNKVNNLYVMLQRGRNLYWQSSQDGLRWASSERAQALTERTRLAATKQYAIVRHHMQGRIDLANRSMRDFLLAEIIELQNELTYIRQQHGNQV